MTNRARLLVVAAALLAASCNGVRLETVLERVLESRRLSAELLTQFLKASEAGNRVVMAFTPDERQAAIGDVAAARDRIEQDSTSLADVLSKLNYGPELALLGEFREGFREYASVEAEIEAFIGEDTNAEAQRLSFGRAASLADDIAAAVGALRPARDGAEAAWRLRAEGAGLVIAVRTIQALQAPHIAERTDAVMTELEKKMTVALADARGRVQTLASLVHSDSRADVERAGARLADFQAVHADIVALSRRNTNVHALALALGNKRVRAAQCEETLRSLQKALGAREIGGGHR